MKTFVYEAKTEAGDIQKGEIEAESSGQAATVLTEKKLFPTEIRTKNESSGLSFLDRFSTKDKVFVTRQLATMISAGLPISQSIRTLAGQTKKTIVKTTLEKLGNSIEGGSTFSNSLRDFPNVFKPIEVAIISAGEKTGKLDDALLRLASQLEKDQSIMKKIRGAMVYPLFVLAVVMIVVVSLSTYIMPQMEDLYAAFNSNLPFMTRALIATSKFIKNGFILLIMILVALVIYARYLIKTNSGRHFWDTLKINTPGIKILFRALYMARFSRVMTGLIGSGVAINDCILITSESVGNVLYEDYLKETVEEVKSGKPLSESLKNEYLFSSIVPEMVAVGEKTGEVEGMFENLAKYFEEEIDNLVRNISSLIEPALIVFLALIVLVVVMGIMMPLYSIGGSIYKG